WPPRVTLGRLLPHARGLGFKPRRGGFPSGAKKEWGLSPKAKVRVLDTAELDVTILLTNYKVGLRRVVPKNYDPKGEKFLIASRFPTPSLACSFFSLRATVTSSSKLSRDQTSNPTSSTNPTPKGRIRRSTKQKVENSNFEENPLPHEVPMVENQTMAQLLQAPTDGYEDAIVIPEIQRFDESFFEVWDRFNDLLRACPYHGFSELHELDTFYNAFNINDQDSLNSAADKKNQYSAPTLSHTPAPIKAVEPNCVTCGGSGTLPSNTITNLKEDLKGITTRSSVAYQGPTILTPSKVAKQGTEVTMDQVQTPNLQTAPVQPMIVQSKSETLVSEPVVAPVSVVMPNLKPSIPYPSRRDNERRRDQANGQIEKFYEIFKDMSFEISFTDVLMLMPKFASTLKALIGNKEKLSEMARTPINEHCSAVILNKLPKKLGYPGKFLIPCEFPGMDECLALADLGASINLMALSVWKGLSLPELTPTCMTLKLANRTESKPIGIPKDVKVKVGVFHFPADFVVVDFEPDPRVSLILGRCFLKTGRALIDVHKGELTLRIENEAITCNLHQTSRYSANYDQMTAKKIDVTDEACEEYSQEVLGFFDEELKACEAKTIKSSIDEPPEVELKDLPPHLEYVFLCMLAIFHDMVEKTMEVFMDEFSVFGNSFENCLSRLDKMLQRCEDTKLCLNWEKSHFMVKRALSLAIKFLKTGLRSTKPKSMSLLNYLILPLSKDTLFVFSEDCIQAFHMLKKKLTEAPILIAPNWDLPFELMCDASDFAIGVVLGQRHEKHFQPIHYASKTLTDAESKYTTTEKEMLAVV
nr:reverse transcriptase domain-containing protein [Tanacetum cinerariifolium]